MCNSVLDQHQVWPISFHQIIQDFNGFV